MHGARIRSEAAAQQLELDLGNLCAYDPSPLDASHLTPLSRDATCLQLATAMTQALVGQLWALPSEAVQGGRLAHLPPPSTPLPREKPIPKPKPLTKWQKFAQVCARTHSSGGGAGPWVLTGTSSGGWGSQLAHWCGSRPQPCATETVMRCSA